MTARTLFLALAITMSAAAQDAARQGETIFKKTCSIGYCHGARGEAGGAPRLVARGFTREFINTTVTRGVSGTAMPPFAATLSRPDLSAVVAYVASINGLDPAGSSSVSKPRPLSADAERGRALFFDSIRGFNRCSTCHEINGVGIPVAAPIGKAPPDLASLRALQTPHVATATVAGESMPALVVSQGKLRTIFFDLTSAPPVQRAVDSTDIRIAPGSVWKHSTATGSYADPELTSIVAYLRAVTQPQ